MNASTQTDLRILLDQIDHNPYQPRHGEDPAVVAAIAASIEHNGLMQVPTAPRKEMPDESNREAIERMLSHAWAFASQPKAEE